MLSALFSLSFVAQCLRISVPYVLPSIGGTLSERGGVVNIALEGMLLVGAFATTVTVFLTGSPILGIVIGIVGGVFLALLHGLATVTFKVDQIVTGIALNLLAIGSTKFCCQFIFHSSSNSPRIVGTEAFDLFGSVQSPVLRELSNPFIIGTALLVAMSHVTLFATAYGLRLRAVGENPEVAETMGLSVARMRYSGLLLSGALSGLGGAWLALDQHSFTDGMSSGRGFIALAALIIGKWKPLNAAGACLLFGCAESLTLRLPGASIPSQFIQMIPYVVTMVVLAGFIGRSTPPASDGIPYEGEGGS